MKKLSALATFAVLLAAPALARVAAQPVSVVAAENFYGDIAKQIGGPDVKVTSILSNPDQDPHLFEVSPSVGRDVSAARIVIYNGIDYDPWMEKLLGAARSTKRETIVVADLVGKKTGDNPHIWYDPATMVALAKTLSEALTADDPGHKAGYEQRLARFEESVKPIQAKAAELRQRLAGTPVTATEPVFGYMFDALGLEVRNQSFQLAVMNNTEPSASDVASFENDLKAHRVKLLIYNSQATDPVADRMVKIAKASHVPVVGATETEPGGKRYQGWMLTKTLSEALTADDPGHKAGYAQRLARFEESVKPIQAKAAELRQRLAGTPVTATEPVFGYMFDALGLEVRNQSFQLAVMNNTEPSASDVAAFENDLKAHRVKLLIYNSQATDPVADRMVKIAKTSHVPVVGATETEPAGKSYQGWMLSELDAVNQALPKQAP
jgi:zinc/manganese transport system substrate-binding protein